MQVTWVEHVEMEHLLPINVMFRNLVLSGAAFGAPRWLAALQRACDRFASLAALGVQHHDPSGGDYTVHLFFLFHGSIPLIFFVNRA